MENINKLSLPVTILLASIVLGGFYYASQMNKQKSIEQQQAIEQLAKSAQNDKDYIAKQKDTCLGIYKVEGSKWNNVSGWRYDESGDGCFIEYKQTPKRTASQCDTDYKDDEGKVMPIFFRDYLLCIDGSFEKQF